MNIGDDIFKNAFEQIARREYEERPVTVEEHRFSLKFRSRMRKLLPRVRIEKSGEKSSVFGVILPAPVKSKGRVACLAALMALTVGGTAFAAEPLVRWLYGQYIEQYSDHVEVKNSQETTPIDAGEFCKYELGYVPEGYSLVSEEYDEVFQERKSVYRNQESKSILVKQKSLDVNGTVITSDEEELEEIAVEGFSGYYIPDSEQSSVILSDGIYTITISGWVSKEELLKTAEGLSLSN